MILMRPPRALLMVLGLVLVLPPAVAKDEASETIANFKRFYAKAEAPRDRYEAVLVLKGLNSLEAAQALEPALEDPDFGVRRAAVEVLGGFHRDDVAHWLVDEVLTDRKAPQPMGISLSDHLAGTFAAYVEVRNVYDRRAREPLAYNYVSGYSVVGDQRSLLTT